MFHLHLVAIGAGFANSMTYFLIATNFAFGSKLVQKGEMRFDQVFRYKTFS
jgi:hypothetical protein